VTERARPRDRVISKPAAYVILATSLVLGLAVWGAVAVWVVLPWFWNALLAWLANNVEEPRTRLIVLMAMIIVCLGGFTLSVHIALRVFRRVG